MKKYKTKNGFDAIFVPHLDGSILCTNDKFWSGSYNYKAIENGYQYGFFGYWNLSTILQAGITLINDIFPKWMSVSNDDHCWAKRLVVADLGDNKKYRFIAVAEAFKENIDDNQGNFYSWRYAKEIIEPKILELTIDQIAEKFNVPANQIKIKK
ncbi:hypothetical protein M0P65_06140 [Candidatus Gracilibacteria bacterium]|jgi:hypothetical protein|nr:hypothetical protein [Candidatus Gracilibacteria bacterium]